MKNSNNLTDWEVHLIKGILKHLPDLTQQAIHSYFSNPGRDFNQRVISQIKSGKIGKFLGTASASEAMTFWAARKLFSQHYPTWMYYHFTSSTPDIKSLTLDWWPTGQGLFSSGIVTTNQGNPINWVYDCGAHPYKKALESSIAAFREQQEYLNLSSIKLVAISHLDQDHISGMAKLLDKRSVETLLLPYIPLWRRLLIAIEKGITAIDDEFQLYVNPTEYIVESLGAEISQIVYVPGTGPDDLPSREETIAGPEPDGELSFEFEEDSPEIPEDVALSAQQQTAVHILRKGGKITSPSLWEFVPYNDVELAPKVDRSIIKNIAPHAKVLQSEATAKEKDGSVREIKKLYDGIFKGSKQRNLISLFLYSGPLNSRFAYGNHKPYSPVAPDLITSFSQLYTGDGYLNEDERVDAFESYYKHDNRLAKSAFLQVMHHGSEKNWQSGIAERINPRWSIFSSDPFHKKYKHPHAKVLRDFYPYGVVQVDKVRGFHFRGIFV